MKTRSDSLVTVVATFLLFTGTFGFSGGNESFSSGSMNLSMVLNNQTMKFQSGLDTRWMTLMWNLSSPSGRLYMAFVAKTIAQYASVGIGYSAMVPAVVVVSCRTGELEGIAEYVLSGYGTKQVHRRDEPLQYEKMSSDFSDLQQIRGYFELDLRRLDRHSFDPSNTHFIWAIGDSRGDSLVHHTWSNVERLQLIDQTRWQQRILVAHGVIMVIWVLVSAGSILVVRILRRKRRVWGKSKWLPIHKYGNLTSTAMCVSGVMVAFQGESTGLIESKLSMIHHRIGFVVGISMLLQVLVALRRPVGPSSRVKQAWWRRTHAFMGFSVWILAMANVFVGLALVNASLVFFVLIAVYTGSFLIATIFLQCERFNNHDYTVALWQDDDRDTEPWLVNDALDSQDS
eukprot:CAMPEP_0184686790 /NCGR_PEP_ID=MMETSP0312-20130426/24010_1 /TAXON_ID=31354 /ORGANISM="Compsopogon coeruleus, Strain SAG 36.94" /LENGTH=399 /DNA_ID=CAMNT_0027142261 /DNA_START=112 /DNA_END=1311 /DNA_ORIENTATION=+